VKKILTILVLAFVMIPVLNAECDYKKEVELGKLASKVTYDRVYNKETNTFTVKLYNVIPELILSYNSEILKSNSDNEIEIKNLKEGTYMQVDINSTNIGCYSSLMTLYINLPYYNVFYDSDKCSKYEDILEVCSSEYTSYLVTQKILDDAIDNYENRIINEDDKIEDIVIENKVTFFEIAQNFITKWGFKIVLSLVTIILSVLVFQAKIRKIKHGI